MSEKYIVNIPEIQTYDKDKRASIKKLYEKFLLLLKPSAFSKKIYWDAELVYNQDIGLKNQEIHLPILGFKTKKQGDALWIISGIHGEEPAGPNAISSNINFIKKLGKKIPIVLIPLCNPSGYRKNWRFPHRKNIPKKGIYPASVGDSEHYLLDLHNQNKPRHKEPSSQDAKALTSYVLNTSQTHKPLLVLDLHEDFSSRELYIYSQGKLGNNDPVAKKIVDILKKADFKLYQKGKTSFGQKIHNGIVSNIKDGSIDELLGSDNIIINHEIKRGPSAKSVVVLETNIVGIPLEKRIKVHSKIIKLSKRFYKLAKNIPSIPVFTFEKYKESDII